MEKVYLLEYCYVNNEYEDTKYLGAFSAKKKAEEALELIKEKPGFNRFPDGFCISEIYINESSWNEGFVYEVPMGEGSEI